LKQEITRLVAKLLALHPELKPAFAWLIIDKIKQNIMIADGMYDLNILLLFELAVSSKRQSIVLTMQE
jgi:hypothetical protein